MCRGWRGPLGDRRGAGGFLSLRAKICEPHWGMRAYGPAAYDRDTAWPALVLAGTFHLGAGAPGPASQGAASTRAVPSFSSLTLWGGLQLSTPASLSSQLDWCLPGWRVPNPLGAVVLAAGGQVWVLSPGHPTADLNIQGSAAPGHLRNPLPEGRS